MMKEIMKVGRFSAVRVRRWCQVQGLVAWNVSFILTKTVLRHLLRWITPFITNITLSLWQALHMLKEVDGHCLVLTFHEDTDYSEYLYCDICEKQRSPYTWFYHCAICDNSAHLHCVVGDHPFIKRGMTFIESHHPHVLVFVEKHCLDLAVECSDAECKYIIH
ncbi:hypothetical protein GOBAR_DD27055 [Gossypium barbadense]|nr:hypothetical protein GOBAR_DD27055 [Gossypium barbadense]